MSNKLLLEIEFDSEVWMSLSDSEKNKWVSKVEDVVNNEARVVSSYLKGDD